MNSTTTCKRYLQRFPQIKKSHAFRPRHWTLPGPALLLRHLGSKGARYISLTRIEAAKMVKTSMERHQWQGSFQNAFRTRSAPNISRRSWFPAEAAQFNMKQLYKRNLTIWAQIGWASYNSRRFCTSCIHARLSLCIVPLTSHQHQTPKKHWQSSKVPRSPWKSQKLWRHSSHHGNSTFASLWNRFASGYIPKWTKPPTFSRKGCLSLRTRFTMDSMLA